MRLLALVSLSIPATNVNVDAGQEFDCPDDLAERFVSNGSAALPGTASVSSVSQSLTEPLYERAPAPLTNEAPPPTTRAEPAPAPAPDASAPTGAEGGE